MWKGRRAHVRRPFRLLTLIGGFAVASPSYVTRHISGGFESLSGEAARAVLRIRVEGLAAENEIYLLEDPTIPLLYESGVVYYDPDPKLEVPWMNVIAALNNRSADCKTLTAWRKAELWIRYRIKSVVEIVEYVTATGRVFHVLLRRATRPGEEVGPHSPTEDPSDKLGMIMSA